MISFLRWKTAGGRSYFFKKFIFFRFENSWIETLGGSGSSMALLETNKITSIFHYVRLGSLIFSFFYDYILHILTFLVVTTLALKELKIS